MGFCLSFYFAQMCWCLNISCGLLPLESLFVEMSSAEVDGSGPQAYPVPPAVLFSPLGP